MKLFPRRVHRMTPIESLEALIDANEAADPTFYMDPKAKELSTGYFFSPNEMRQMRSAVDYSLTFSTLARVHDASNAYMRASARSGSNTLMAYSADTVYGELPNFGQQRAMR